MLTKELSTAERVSLRFIEPMYAEPVRELAMAASEVMRRSSTVPCFAASGIGVRRRQNFFIKKRNIGESRASSPSEAIVAPWMNRGLTEYFARVA
jgi:hypothetical protein